MARTATLVAEPEPAYAISTRILAPEAKFNLCNTAPIPRAVVGKKRKGVKPAIVFEPHDRRYYFSVRSSAIAAKPEVVFSRSSPNSCLATSVSREKPQSLVVGLQVTLEVITSLDKLDMRLGFSP